MAIAGGVLVVVLHDWILSASLLAGAAVLLMVARSRLGPWFISPTRVLAVVYVGMAVIGPILYPIVSDAPSGASARLTVEPQDLQRTSQLFLVAALAATIGSLAVAGPQKKRLARRIEAFRPRAASWSSGPDPKVAAHVILALSIVGIVATVIGTGGVQTLLERDFYIEGRTVSRAFFTLGQWLGIPSVIGLAYVVAKSRNGGVRAVSVTVLAVQAAVFFSLGSRRMALLPLLIAAGLIIANPSTRGTARLLFVGALLSVVTLQLPLVLRAQEKHGLIPYTRVLMGEGTAVAVPGEAVLRNIFVSYAIAHEVAYKVVPLPASELTTSLNPLPGSLVGTELTDSTHRLNAATPYSLLGEMRNYGLGATVAFFVIAGAVLGYAERRIRSLLSAGEALWAVALFGTGSLFVVMSLQYPTRGASRFLYYVLIMDIGIRVWFLLRRTPRGGGADIPRRPAETFLNGLRV